MFLLLLLPYFWPRLPRLLSPPRPFAIPFFCAATESLDVGVLPPPRGLVTMVTGVPSRRITTSSPLPFSKRRNLLEDALLLPLLLVLLLLFKLRLRLFILIASKEEEEVDLPPPDATLPVAVEEIGGHSMSLVLFVGYSLFPAKIGCASLYEDTDLPLFCCRCICSCNKGYQ